MNINKKNHGWILCPSQTFPGKFYYFNVSTGEAAWSLGHDEAKIKKDSIPKASGNYSHPEPSGLPNDVSQTSAVPYISRQMIHPTPVFGQPAFPKPLQIKTEDPNVIWTPIHIQMPIVFAPDQGKNTDTKTSQIPSQLTVGNEYKEQSSNKPLCRRFINYEEPVISFNKDNKIEDVRQFERFYTSTPTKAITSTQKYQGANLFHSDINLSFSDLSAKANKNNLVKQMVYKINLPADPETVINEKELQDSFQNLDLVTKTSTSSLSSPHIGTQLQTKRPEMVLTPWKMFPSPSKASETTKKVPVLSNKFDFSNTTPKPTDNFAVKPNFTMNESSKVMNTNDRLNNFGDDLRTFLRAKRRNGGFKTDSGNCGTSKAPAIKQEVPATAKKKVTFKLDHNESIVQNDFEYESVYDCTAERLRRLAPRGGGRWCIVTDAGSLLDEYEFIAGLVQSDPSCRLLVPCAVVKEISAISVGETLDRDYVIRARTIIRRLPEAYIILQSTEGVTSLSKTKSILNCCLEAKNQNMHVILITSNSELMSLASANSIQYFTIREIKYGAVPNRIQDGGAGNEIQDGGQKAKDFKQMKITIQNIPEQNDEFNGIHSFRTNLFEVDDLNDREREILRQIKSESLNGFNGHSELSKAEIPQKPKYENVHISIANEKVSSPGFEGNPFSDSNSKFHKDNTKLSFTNELTKSNYFIFNANSDPQALKWKNAFCGSTLTNCLPSIKRNENAVPSHNNTSHKIDLEKHYSDENMSFYFQNDPSKLENSNPNTDEQIVSKSIQKEQFVSIFEPRDTDFEKQTNSIYEIDNQPIFKLNEPDEPRNTFKKGTDTYSNQITDFKNPFQYLVVSQFKMSETPQTRSNFKIESQKPETQQTRSNFKIEFQKPETQQTRSNFEIEFQKPETQQTRSNFKIESQKPETQQTRSNFEIEFQKPETQQTRSNFKIESQKPETQQTRSNFEIEFQKPETQQTRSNFKIEFQKPEITRHSNFKIDGSQPQTTSKYGSNSHSQFKHQIKSNTANSTEKHSKFKIEHMPANSKKIDLSRFTLKSELIEKRLNERIDEWMCSFIQYMEECLTDVLVRLSSSGLKLIFSPWSLYEALQCTKEIYKEHQFLRNLIDQLCGYLYETDYQNDSLKKKKNAADFLKAIGCGIYIVKYLKNIVQNCNGIQETEAYLIELLRDIEEPDRDTAEPLSRTPVTTRLEDRIHKQNFVKHPSEIVNYLKKHYPEWKSIENDKMTDKANVIRTLGKDLNMLKLNRNAFTVSENKGGQITSKSSVAINNNQKNRAESRKDMEAVTKKTNNRNTLNMKITACDNVAKTIVNTKPNTRNTKSMDIKASNIVTKAIEHNEHNKTKVGNIAAKSKDINSCKSEVSTKKLTVGTKIQLRRNNVASLDIDKNTKQSASNENGNTDLKSDLNETRDIFINNMKLDKKTLGIKVTVPNDYTANTNLDTQLQNLYTEFDIGIVTAKVGDNDSGINNPKIIRNANLIEEFESRIKSKLNNSFTEDNEGDSNKDIDFDEDTTYKLYHSDEHCEDPDDLMENLNVQDSTDYKNDQNDGVNDDFSKHYLVKDDLKSDSGFENDISHMFSTVQTFSSELGSSLDAIKQYIDGSIEEFRMGVVGDETKAHFRLKAFEVNFLLTKSIIKLTKLAQREITDDTETIAKCLARAQILQKLLNGMLTVTN